MEQDEPWMTVEDMAKHLGVNAETVRRWIRDGEIPVLDLRSRKAGYRLRKSDVDRFIAQRYGYVGKDAA